MLALDRDDVRSDVLDGVLEAFRGRRKVPRPEGWSDLYAGLATVKPPALLDRVLRLAVILDEPRAVEALRTVLMEPTSDPARRASALSTLVERRTPGLERDLPGLLDDASLRAPVLRAMAAFPTPDAPKIILGRYASLSPAEREDAVATLASRSAWAMALLDAVEHGTVPRREVSVPIARQILALNDAPLTHRLEAVWGSVRATSADKAALIGKYKAVLGSGESNPSAGRAVFRRTCYNCHKLFDDGGDVGPELTGSDRRNADYILENVLDPSASVAREYTVTNVATNDGRLVSGILRAQTDAVLTIQTANERLLIPREDVEAIKASKVSMMPEGQLEALSPQEIRDLFSYLAAPGQVAPPR